AYEQAIRILPNDPSIYVGRGILYHDLGRDDEATIDFNKALDLSPNHIDAHLGLAAVRHSQQDYPGAIEAYQAVLAQDDEDLQALNNLACLYVDDLDVPNKALPFAQKAWQLSPRHPIYTDTLGWTLARLGHLRRALPMLQAAVQAMPSYETHSHLGWTLEQLGDADGAREHYEAASALTEGDGS
ncbi:MAG: tetratricopeptide repeat protein, partial [Planctomycetota bacterium]